MGRRISTEVAERYRARVRECRLRAMVPKQGDLARMTGINRNIISALENGRLFLSSTYALLIAEALGCSLDDLFEKCAATPPDRSQFRKRTPKGPEA